MSVRKLLFIGIVIIYFGCTSKIPSDDFLFSLIDVEQAGIDFQNDLSYTNEINVYTFRNFYNGAGVGIGDFNNDGLNDLFFCGNQVDNKLYLNKGDFEFLDVTDRSGTASRGVWTTGVSIVDINGDGWLDYYVCKSGDVNTSRRHNELFINQGIVDSLDGIAIIAFEERSKEYGLDDLGLSTHAAFFDYDLDGDLDCYLLNNSMRSVGNYDLIPGQRKIRDTLGGNKLLKNLSIESDKPNPVFTDVSEEAGIYGSAIGFGLGVTIGDVNNDGYPDIFVSNDFFEKDYLYINQRDGSFEERIDENIAELSMGSMGADMADINNDGAPEIFVTEMLPDDEKRLKTKALFENWNKHEANFKKGYHRQFARNALHYNLGDGNFSEVARYSGVEATDWSWGALIFDMDNDGYKDIFVANGIYKDLLDQDYINFYSNPAEVRKILFDDEGGLDRLVDMIPSEPLSNFAFKNGGDLTFENVSDDWGFSAKTFSNGSAYGDLDNDGDLDIVVNNVNMPPGIYRNNQEENRFVQFALTDLTTLNRNAIGAKIYGYIDKEIIYSEVNPARGFMSSVPNTLHLGVGSHRSLDSVMIMWPNGETTMRYDLETNQFYRISYNEEAVIAGSKDVALNTILSRVPTFRTAPPHEENDYSDFDREPLLFEMHSNLGPACCKGDINNDGLDDFYLGGANGQAGSLMVQNPDGSFRKVSEAIFESDKNSEDVECIFFDANNDDQPDLYVASGSSEYGPNNFNLADRIYLNDGNFEFSKSQQVLPTFQFENTSDVVNTDYDQDGDEDLIVSIFIQPFAYGIKSNTYVLQNDGSGNFTNATTERAPDFTALGMVSAMNTIDIDQDGDEDLILVGEWMGIQLMINEEGSFVRHSSEVLNDLKGLWKTIHVVDVNNDDRQDMIIGNHGLNSRLRASDEFPMRMYINDFDKNGRIDQIFTYQSEEGEFPLAQRSDLLNQLPYLHKNFPDFKSYGLKSIQEIFSEELLAKSVVYTINEMSSVLILNLGGLNFELMRLNKEAQLSTVFTIESGDYNNDTYLDLLIGGNQFRMKPEIGSNGASLGLLLHGNGQGSFTPIAPVHSGISESGEIRKIINLKNDKILIAKNNDVPVLYEINQ